jgi:hypothetical protein
MSKISRVEVISFVKNGEAVTATVLADGIFNIFQRTQLN